MQKINLLFFFLQKGANILSMLEIYVTIIINEVDALITNFLKFTSMSTILDWIEKYGHMLPERVGS